jgi:hypothetical protein
MPVAHETALPTPQLPNSQAAVEHRAKAGLVPWTGVLLVLIARPILIVAAHALTALILFALHRPSPWLAAGYWWTVYGTLVDIGCLCCLFWFTRREGIRLRDLLGPIRLRHGRDIVLGLGFFLLVFPLFVVSGILAHKMLFGPGIHDPGLYLGQPHPMPVWAILYTFGVWWIIWSATEEATYQAYLLPRLRVLSNRTWVTFLVVGFVWAFQHALFPLIPDWRFILFRTLAFVPGALAMMIIYWRTRRLAPLIVAHWPMDIAGAFMMVILPNM